MKYKMGFIGAGNMGGALATAACAGNGAENVAIYDLDTAKAAALAEKLGCAAVGMEELVKESKYIFLGVKPQVMQSALSGIVPFLKARNDRFILVTMAAGLSISTISQMAGDKYPTIRIMPNMPAAVGEAMILYAACPVITAEEKEEFVKLMGSAGRLAELPEGLIDAGCCVSSCGPAFAFMFIEALADGGVKCGLPRDKAQMLAAQMLAGSAKMVLESGRHPGELKDAVCSPGGTTIAGVHALESGAFRALCIEAVEAAYEKTLELGKK